MKIAVTYENGNVFQHFGKTQYFKIYTTDENKDLTSFKVVSTNGQGHGALADFLEANGVDVLICGGIGLGAQQALSEKGIDIYGGNFGSADNAVVAFLAGKLEQKGVTCDHHHHEGEGHSCGEHGCKS